jgi:valyl-tRNA synthetase
LVQKYSEAVREAFIHLFENGTICREDEIINWSCELGSTISDIEVDQVNFTGKTSLHVPGYDHQIDFGLLYLCAYALENSGSI